MARHGKSELPRLLQEPERGPGAIANFHGRPSVDERKSPARSRKPSGSAHDVDPHRSSAGINDDSDPAVRDDDEAEESWSDAVDRQPKLYSTFSEAVEASRSSPSRVASSSKLPPSSPQGRSVSSAYSPMISSPRSPSSGNDPLSAGHRRESSGARRLEPGVANLRSSPAGLDVALAGPAPGRMVKQTSWSATSSSSPLGTSRKELEPNPSSSRGSFSGPDRSALVPPLRLRASMLHDQRNTGNPVLASPDPVRSVLRDGSHQQENLGLGLRGLALLSPHPDVSEFEQGRGFGWTPEGQRRGSIGKGKAPMRDGFEASLTSKGSFTRLGKPSLATSEVDLNRSLRATSSGLHRLPSNLSRASQDFTAVSLEQEQLSKRQEPSGSSRTSAFAKLGKAFRRKNKVTDESKPTTVAELRTASPALRQVRRTASQHALNQHKPSVDEAPPSMPLAALPHVSALPAVLPPPSASTSAARAGPASDPAEAPRSVALDPADDRRHDSGLATPRAAFRPPPGGPPSPTGKVVTLGSTDSSNARNLRMDTTPIPGRGPASPSVPLSRPSVQRHKAQSSIDSSSSSARRLSLAFLASAISMGSLADTGSSADSLKPRNPSATSLDLHRPSTALGTVSTPPSASFERATPASEAKLAPSSDVGPISIDSLAPATHAQPVSIRNLNRIKLTPKPATREDNIPSVLSEFLKMDASESRANGRANGKKTAAALYADANRSSSEDQGPDPIRPVARYHQDSSSNGEHRGPFDAHGATSARKGSAEEKGDMSGLYRPSSNKSTGASTDGKRNAFSVSPTSTRSMAKGTFMAPPAGPSMGGYASPFFVAPLTSVDSGLATRAHLPSGRRASVSSRSVTSEEGKGTKSAISTSHKVSTARASLGSDAPEPARKIVSQDRVARRAKSQNNLKALQKELDPSATPTSVSSELRKPERSGAASSSQKNNSRQSSSAANPPSEVPNALLSRANSRLRSASGSSTFSQRFFRRPRTAGGDLNADPMPNLQASSEAKADDGQRAASYDLVSSPTDSIEFEMLDIGLRAPEIDAGRRGSAAADFAQALQDQAPAPLNSAGRSSTSSKRDSRGRSNSIASPDAFAQARRNGLPYNRASSDVHLSEGPSGDLTDDATPRRNFSPSKLESSGGAAGLFGGGGSGGGSGGGIGGSGTRQRTSSLLPSFGFSRARTSSNAGQGPLTRTAASGSGSRSEAPGPDVSTNAIHIPGLLSHDARGQSFATALTSIASTDRASQSTPRRQISSRDVAPGRGQSSSTDFQRRSASASLLPEDAVYRSSKDSGEENRSTGRLSISSARVSTSSRPSFQRRLSSRTQASGNDLELPSDPQPSARSSSKEHMPWPDESAEEYAERIAETVPKTEIAAVLASSADPFYVEALRHHMTIFWFNGNPLDIALRKLLMDLHLPKETQQIDRVMEAFAKRYNECNDGLFASDDQPYILSFSLMMLHTDAFNKNAKHKMTKADYLRNTGPSGVPTEILEYLFDNLTFTQFIYVEDKDDLHRRANDASAIGAGGSNAPVLSSFSASNPAAQAARTRIDPYYLIAQGKLGELRADIDHLIPEDTPFSFTGTLAGFDIDRLTAAFLHAPSIEIATGRPAGPPASGWAGLEHMSTAALPQEDEVVSLKVTKVGVVSRKDDVGDGGRKTASRKWKACGLLLTGSQLLLFKDIVWTTALQSQILDQVGHSQLSNGIGPGGPEEAEPVEGGIVISPRITYFRPDGVISLADAVAVKDNTYTKYDFVFRLLAAKGRQYLVQAQNEDDMNDWIHKINFCACFRTCDIKIRGLDLASKFPSGHAPPSSRRESRSQARRPSAASDARSVMSEGIKLGQSSNFSSMSDMEAPVGFDPPATAPQVTSAGQASYEEDQEELEDGNPLSQDDGLGSLSPTSRSRASSRASNAQPMTLLQKRIAARRELMLSKIDQTNVELRRVTETLNEELRLARHFAVLTPFQKITRDRIEAAALPLSRRIKQLRLELSKEESRIKILKLDLAAGERVARGAMPSLKLSASFVNDAKRIPGSQLATPQLLELGDASESQVGFEDLFGSSSKAASMASRGGDPEVASPIEAAGRARLAQSQRRPSYDDMSGIVTTSASVKRSVNGSLQPIAVPLPAHLSSGGNNSNSSSSSSSKITRPAYQQRNQTNLNSVSEQPADESPVLGSRMQMSTADSSFQSSRTSDIDLAGAKRIGSDEGRDAASPDPMRSAKGRSGGRNASRDEQARARSPARSSVSRSSTSIDGRGDLSADSLPLEADEVPEEWDMSRLARDGGNRISLVDLPSPGELKEATTRRFIFGVSENSTVDGVGP